MTTLLFETLDLSAEYNNSARVPEAPAIIERWQLEAAAYRAAVGARRHSFAYGPSPRQTLEVFAPLSDAAPRVVLFIHGGYWQSQVPQTFSHMAGGLNARGVTVAIAGYDLCPEVTIGAIIDQVRAAARALHRETGRAIVATGHSAGGHLAACLLATDWAAQAETATASLVPAAVGIAGVYELEPLIPTHLNAKLRLSVETARAWSPRGWRPPQGLAFDAVVGGAESREFHRQSLGIAAGWGGAGVRTTYGEVEGANHFTVIDPLADPESALVARLWAHATA